MNKLNDFFQFINNIIISERELMSKLLLLRNALRVALQDAEFKLGCVENIIMSMETAKNNNIIWQMPNMFSGKDDQFSVRVVYWPAFYHNNPHQHKTWSVTGVLSNQINIATYQFLENEKLKQDKSMMASIGEVGYLVPGCIHSVSNPTHEVSASLHIFNNVNPLYPEENAIWYPAPRKYNLSKGLLERALTVCLDLIDSNDLEQSFNLIQRIYLLSPIALKFRAIHKMYQYDKIYAKNCYSALETTF